MLTRLEDLRAEYRALRAACERYTAQQFDEVVAPIAHELADGEDITPQVWVAAAHMVAEGWDHA